MSGQPNKLLKELTMQLVNEEPKIVTNALESTSPSRKTKVDELTALGLEWSTLLFSTCSMRLSSKLSKGISRLKQLSNAGIDFSTYLDFSTQVRKEKSTTDFNTLSEH